MKPSQSRSSGPPRAATVQKCPICGKGLPRDLNLRYPKRLCGACMAQASSKGGRLVEFSNVAGVKEKKARLIILVGGVHGTYVDSGRPYRSTICFVNGIKCTVKEAHFGGIVIEPRDDSAGLPKQRGKLDRMQGQMDRERMRRKLSTPKRSLRRKPLRLRTKAKGSDE